MQAGRNSILEFGKRILNDGFLIADVLGVVYFKGLVAGCFSVVSVIQSGGRLVSSFQQKQLGWQAFCAFGWFVTSIS